MNQGLDVVLGLRPVSYQWKKAYTENRGMDENANYFGFISQEVEKVFPETVIQRSIKVGEQDVEDFRFINLTNFTPVLVNAIQEQQKLIKYQASEIKGLKKKISVMEQKLDNKLSALNQNNEDKITNLANELKAIKAYIYELNKENQPTSNTNSTEK